MRVQPKPHHVRTTVCFFLLFFTLASCKKESQNYDPVADDKSISQFTRDLYGALVENNKTSHILDDLNKDDRLDWSKIVLRISFDSTANINYSIPIIQRGGSCNTFIEVTLSGPKTASNVKVNKYDPETL